MALPGYADQPCPVGVVNDVARDVHCENIMGHSIVIVSWCYNAYWCCYDPHLLCITTPNYDISVFLVQSLKLYIKH